MKTSTEAAKWPSNQAGKQASIWQVAWLKQAASNEKRERPSGQHANIQANKPCNFASTRATQLIHVATGCDNFKDIEMQQDDDPHVFTSTLET
jgi:hypothetical protein